MYTLFTFPNISSYEGVDEQHFEKTIYHLLLLSDSEPLHVQPSPELGSCIYTALAVALYGL